MSDIYPKLKELKNYTIRIDRMPYELSLDEKAELTDIFNDVMSNLAFYARDVFVSKLFSTEYLVRIYDIYGSVVGFGNAYYRVCGGVNVVHIMSIYVLRRFRGVKVMERTWRFFLVEQAKANNHCLEKPLYFTASTVNAQVLYTSARIYSIWPDLINNSSVPPKVRQIAEGANEFYPTPGDHIFQVKITEEFAGIKDGVGHNTRDLEFNERFYGLADTGKYELVFFVGRIDTNDLVRLAEAESATSVLRESVARSTPAA